MLMFKKIIEDFEWVMKVLESAQTKKQMEAVERCFRLWELKHIHDRVSVLDMMSINNLRRNFWVSFKNKNIKFG